MQKTPLNHAKTGMASADGMTAADGAPVNDTAPAGLELAGVTELVVQDTAVPEVKAGYDARMRAERVSHLFRAYRNDNFMTALQDMLHKHFTARA